MDLTTERKGKEGTEEVYVLRLSQEDIKAVLVAAEKVQQKVNACALTGNLEKRAKVSELDTRGSDKSLSQRIDLASLPDIPDLELENDLKLQLRAR